MSNDPSPSHPALSAYDVEENCLLIGGIPLIRLAERMGSTPFFAYDRGKLTARIELLREELPEELRVTYAIKANPLPAVVQHLNDLVDGFDVASAAEMQTALDTRMAPEHISFAGPGKTPQELSQAVAAGITLSMESEGEMRRLAEISNQQGRRPRVVIRINPDFQLKASGMRMGGGPQQFGVDAERVPQMLGELAKLDLEFLGFHIFSGSQNLNAEILCDAQEKTVNLAVSLAKYAPGPVRHLNLGGGFGIPYFPKDRPLDLGTVGANLRKLLPRLKESLPEVRPIIELGRFIVGEAGVYVTKVIDRKESRGQVFLVTDGGLNHHLAASGNFGQVIRRNYPVAIGNKMNGKAKETVSVVGCLCTPLDLLADKVELPAAEVGDLVVVFQSGAYGPTASPAGFLSHPSPLEALV